MREMLGKFPTPPHPDGPSLACPLCLLSLLNPQELLGQRVPSEGNLENRRGPGGLRWVCGGQRAQFKRPRKARKEVGALEGGGSPRRRRELESRRDPRGWKWGHQKTEDSAWREEGPWKQAPEGCSGVGRG